MNDKNNNQAHPLKFDAILRCFCETEIFLFFYLKNICIRKKNVYICSIIFCFINIINGGTLTQLATFSL